MDRAYIFHGGQILLLGAKKNARVAEPLPPPPDYIAV